MSVSGEYRCSSLLSFSVFTVNLTKITMRIAGIIPTKPIKKIPDRIISWKTVFRNNCPTESIK